MVYFLDDENFGEWRARCRCTVVPCGQLQVSANESLRDVSEHTNKPKTTRPSETFCDRFSVIHYENSLFKEWFECVCTESKLHVIYGVIRSFRIRLVCECNYSQSFMLHVFLAGFYYITPICKVTLLNCY